MSKTGFVGHACSILYFVANRVSRPCRSQNSIHWGSSRKPTFFFSHDGQVKWLDQSVCLEFRFGDVQPAKVCMFHTCAPHPASAFCWKLSFGCSRVTQKKNKMAPPKKRRVSGVIHVLSMKTNFLNCITKCRMWVAPGCAYQSSKSAENLSVTKIYPACKWGFRSFRNH